MQLTINYAFLTCRVDPSASNMPKHEPLSLGAVPNSVVLWQAEPKAPDAERYYNFRYIRGKTIGSTSLFLSYSLKNKS